jgi:hypothetical protein
MASPSSGGFQRDQVGHAVQPSGQRFPSADGTGGSGEGKEDCLKGIFGVGVASESPTADRENHRPMPTNESSESYLVGRLDKTLEELGIRIDSRRWTQPRKEAE